MSKQVLEELGDSKQPLSKKELIRLAREAGFQPHQGKKHLRFTHNDYPEVSFGVSRDSSAYLSRLNLVDAIKTGGKIKAKARKAFTEAAKKEVDDRLIAIQKQLPNYVKAKYSKDKSKIFVRDKNVPQIGFTLASPAEDYLLENRLRNQLDVMKREFFILLSRSEMQYDMVVEFDKNGTFTGKLSHSVYDLAPLELLPYPEGGDPFAALHAYQERIVEIDLDHAARKEAALEKIGSKSLLIVHSARRGERTNQVTYKIPGVDQTLKFTFETFSNQRVHGDGKHARISLAELEKLERIASGIEQKMRNSHTPKALKLKKAA